MFIFLKSKKTGHCIQSVNKDTTIVLEVRGALLVASLYPWGAAGVPPRAVTAPGWSFVPTGLTGGDGVWEQGDSTPRDIMG